LDDCGTSVAFYGVSLSSPLFPKLFTTLGQLRLPAEESIAINPLNIELANSIG
jgi:hypothetical protein